MTSTDSKTPVTVQVDLFSDLRKYLPLGTTGTMSRTLPAGSTVADLIAALMIPEIEEITVGINGDQAARTSILAEGDQVMLLTPMEGGAALAE